MVSITTARLSLLLFVWVLLQDCETRGEWPCENSCGGIPVRYPFSTTVDCGGSPAFEPYINCTDNELRFYTPTGSYLVSGIDYSSNILVIEDSSASTCSQMQKSQSFGLPLASPFAIAPATTFVLLACSPFTMVRPALCDSSLAALQICSALYGCSSVYGIGLAPGSPASSCCVYAANQYPASPINLPFLQCSSYASIYSFGASSYSHNGLIDYSSLNPSSWSYGIALSFYYDRSGDEYGVCNICQRSNGICSFNVHGFVCVCGNNGLINSSDHCSYGTDFYANGGGSHAAAYPPRYLFGLGGKLSYASGVSLLLGILSYLL